MESEEGQSPDQESNGKSRKRKPELPDFNEVPAPNQIVRTALLRGFDIESGIATFAFEQDGVISEFTAELPQTDPFGQRDPMYSKNYETLIKRLGKDEGVPALIVRMVEQEGKVPRLILAQPAAPQTNGRFLWKGNELRWTDELDDAVDIDFEAKSRQFVNGYLEDLTDLENPKLAVQLFEETRKNALKIVQNQAKEAGINWSAKKIEDVFTSKAAKQPADVFMGAENNRSVRYDIRYAFSQQSGHVVSEDARIEALINYAMQTAMVESIAMASKDSVMIDEETKGSLYAAQQAELVGSDLLLASNPNLQSLKDIFSMYSYETVRLMAAKTISGAMDAAGVPSARPAIDDIEKEKRELDDDTSLHKYALKEIPKDLEKPEERAGAYLRCLANIADGEREVTLEKVGATQTNVAPSNRQQAKDSDRPNALGDGSKKALKYIESMVDGF